MSSSTRLISGRFGQQRSQEKGIFVRLAERWKAARARRLLVEMDDRMLADIGASRAEAVWEDSRPIWERVDTLR